jgi:hypothetical protein
MEWYKIVLAILVVIGVCWVISEKKPNKIEDNENI